MVVMCETEMTSCSSIESCGGGLLNNGDEVLHCQGRCQWQTDVATWLFVEWKLILPELLAQKVEKAKATVMKIDDVRVKC